MSIKTNLQQAATVVSQTKHTNPLSIPIDRAAPAPWVRNPSWLSMPTVLETEQKVVSLFAVQPGGTSVAFTISGAYTVDWGDGSAVQNFSSGATASKDYNYNASSLANTDAPVTFTASTSTVNRTSHGYTNGMNVQFYNIVTTTGITEGVNYYVINATADTFQVASTLGGTALTLTGDGSATLLWYKQCLITITPQGAANFTSLAFNILPTSKTGAGFNSTNPYGVGHLDMIFSGSQIGSFTLSSAANPISLRLLERAQFISTNTITSFQNTFVGCVRLQSVPVWKTYTGANINATSMFAGCNLLATAPDIDTSKFNVITTMFSGCVSLASVPAYDFSSVVVAQSLFQTCVSLKSVPLFKFNPSVLTGSVASMFSGCSVLTEVPGFDFSSVSSVTSMFLGCSKLTTAPNLKLPSTGSGFSAFGMFQSCPSLVNLPPLDLSKATDTSSMFSGCVSLISLPWPSINLTSGTLASGMFQNCSSLQSIPDITFGPTTITVSSAFSGCSSLKSIGTVTLPSSSSSLTANNMFQNCVVLQNVKIANTGTLTFVSGMFSGCTALQTVTWTGPMSVTNSTSGMFASCPNLISHTPITVATNTSSANFPNPYAGVCNVRKGGISNASNTLTIGPILASVSDFNTYYLNTIGRAQSPATAATLTISNCSASGQTLLSVVTPTQGSKTISMSITTGLSVGMSIGGNWAGSDGTNTRTVSGTVSTSTISATAHGLPNGQPVCFSAISTVTGITTYTVYYVINATTDTFQIATTVGGSAITFGGTSSTMTLAYIAKITSITPNTSITIDVPTYSATGSTWTFRLCDVTIPFLRGWSFSG